jgi:hypothetical protein
VRIIPSPSHGGNGSGIAFAGDKFYIATTGATSSWIDEYRLSDASWVRPVRSFEPASLDGMTQASTSSLWVAWQGMMSVAEVDVATGDILQLAGTVPCADLELGPAWPPVPRVCPGDCDCDGHVGFSDIDYFVEAIPDNPYSWAALYMYRHGGAQPPCPFASCDADGDGHVGFLDIDPFVALIPSTCP